MIFVHSKVSDGNMSFLYGDEKEVLKNKENFFRKNNINPNYVVEIKQIHSNKVLVASNNQKLKEADGIITNNPEIILSIKVADCMSISFYDPNKKAIALIHAGYKGLENKIIKKTIQKLKKTFQTSPSDLEVTISPSIGPCHYRIDLWDEAERQLIKTGVLLDKIENPKICTYESKQYYSHRRSQDTHTKEGRFVTILGIKDVN
jgi:YfiH family protein